MSSLAFKVNFFFMNLLVLDLKNINFFGNVYFFVRIVCLVNEWFYWQSCYLLIDTESYCMLLLLTMLLMFMGGVHDLAFHFY